MVAPMSAADGGPAAGLLRRCAAFALDYVLIAAYLVVVFAAGALLRLAAPAAAAAPLFGDPLIAELTGFLTLTLPVSLYFVLTESSSAGATWGKRRMRLRVVTDGGERLGLGRSALRTALKFVPWELSHALIWRFAFASGDAPGYLTLRACRGLAADRRKCCERARRPAASVAVGRSLGHPRGARLTGAGRRRAGRGTPWATDLPPRTRRAAVAAYG